MKKLDLTYRDRTFTVEVPDSRLTKRQTKILQRDIPVTLDGTDLTVTIEARFDDECGNGHNSFFLKAWAYEANKPKIDRYWRQLSEEAIAHHFPEYAHLLKWNHTSTDGPMAYLSNTLYHACDRDHNGQRAGDPVQTDIVVALEVKGEKHTHTIPIYEPNPFSSTANNFPAFWEAINNEGGFHKMRLFNKPTNERTVLTLVCGAHSLHGGTKLHPRDIDTGYAVSGFTFLTEAMQKEGLQTVVDLWNGRADLVLHAEVKEVSEGYPPDLEAARRSAVWLDATIEQLQDVDLLVARLPALMQEFKADMESLGFVY